MTTDGLASTEDGAGAGAYLDARTALPRPGDTVDRYLLVEALGEGAMGVVFRATDADLHRDVALKLLREPTGGDRARARLLDEARAMARLAHPGVVAVYDVGSAGGHDFVAMELVAGTTLAAWMKPRRPWREVVARFIAAGRGLAAAHAAGVIHRDFKPHNVLCGAGGRVAVADFGLAVVAAADEDGGARGIAGTPAYMAPEQHAGDAATAKSDQFAFAVALFEGVYGARPFTAATLAGMGAAIARGPVFPADAARAGVPARLRRAIARGLAADPAARHRDLPALLAELEAILGARRRRIVGGTALAAVAGGIAAAIFLGGAAPARPACEATRFAAVWPGAARARAEAALAGAPDVQRAVLAGLDGYAARWDARWSALCELEDGGSPAFHAVASCLLDGRDQAAALVDELPRLHPDALAAAVPAVERLPEPASCAAPAAALPLDPDVRARVRGVEAELARLRGSTVTASEDHRAAARAIVERARALGHRPLLASALTELANLETNATELAAARAHYTEAALVAEEANAADVRAAALVLLAELEDGFSSDPVAQERAARQAAAALESAPPSPGLRSRLLVVRSHLAENAGDLAAALRFADEAIAIHAADEQPGAGANAVLRRTRVLRAMGDTSGALAAIEAELARIAAAWGPRCGRCPMMHFEAAFALDALGRHAEAQARADLALALSNVTPRAPGPRRVLGRIVDHAGRPVAGATIVAVDGELRGDPQHLVQPHDRWGLATGGYRVTSDGDGRFELGLTGSGWLVIAEHAGAGRSLAHRIAPAPPAAPLELTLALAPWAELHGEVEAPRDTHVHVAPATPVARHPTDPAYRLEVPIIDGRWRARVPAGPHDVRLVRANVRFESALDAVRVTARAGDDVAVPLAKPGDIEVIVRVRGDRDVPTPHAGVVFLTGHRGERTLSGAEMLRLYSAERGAARAHETVPDGAGGSSVSLPDVAPGPYTLCVAAVPGDLHDPTVRARVISNAELLDGPCRHVWVTAAPPRQEVTVEVPAPRRLP